MSGLAKQATAAGAAVITAGAIAVAPPVQQPPPAPAPSVQMRTDVRLAAAFDPFSLKDWLGPTVTPPRLGAAVQDINNTVIDLVGSMAGTDLPEIRQVAGLQTGQLVAIQVVGVRTEEVGGVQVHVIEVKVLNPKPGEGSGGVTTSPPAGAPVDLVGSLFGTDLPESAQAAGLKRGQFVAIQVVGITTGEVAGVQVPVIQIKVLNPKPDEDVAEANTLPPSGPQDLRPSFDQQDVRPSNGPQDVRPSFDQQNVRPSNGPQDLRPSFDQQDMRPSNGPQDLRKLSPFNIGSELNPSQDTTTTLRGRTPLRDALSDLRDSVIGTIQSAGAPNSSAGAPNLSAGAPNLSAPNPGSLAGSKKENLAGAIKRATDSLAGGIAGPKRSSQ